ncbi:DUF7547 family protein [Salinigranum marinum]|uniref:DUF7547 family protein n=1 Tax=Salinigranum marinum TaxID=1515595 RepID=UPI002989C265|nr:hypothetical protein [Salinigranum marinum]
MSRDRDPDDLAALLGDLRTTLDELERTIDTDARTDRRRPRSRDPPRGSDVVRFTEEYTIPTVIAILETTIQSLELLRGVLRLVDPERGFPTDRRGGDRFDGVDGRVVQGAERAVEDLRRALTGTEEPADPVARDVLGDARGLTAEIESLLAEARGDADASRAESASRRSRTGRRDDRESVVIPVDDETDAGRTDDRQTDDHSDDEAGDDAGVEIDVDAELESIRDEVHGESTAVDGAEADDEGDGENGTENEV